MSRDVTIHIDLDLHVDMGKKLIIHPKKLPNNL